MSAGSCGPREEPRIDPPCSWIRLTLSGDQFELVCGRSSAQTLVAKAETRRPCFTP